MNLGMDPSVPPVVHTPRKVPIALLKPLRAKLKEMEEDGVIEKEEEHTPWASSSPVTHKRKAKDRDVNIPPSKDNVRICIDPWDLNKALKRLHYPMFTVQDVATRLSGAKSFTYSMPEVATDNSTVDDESSKL